MPAQELLALQTSVGNRAVNRMLSTRSAPTVQRLVGDEGLAKGGHVWNLSGKRFKIDEVSAKRFRLIEDTAPEPLAPVSKPPVDTTPAMPPVRTATTAAPPPPVMRPRLPASPSQKPISFRGGGRLPDRIDVGSAGTVADLWINTDDASYYHSAEAAAAAVKAKAAVEGEAKLKAAAEAVRLERDAQIGTAFGPLGPEPLLLSGAEYDFAWWFNYMWSEARIAPLDERAAIAAWARNREAKEVYAPAAVPTVETDAIAARFNGYDEKGILKALLALGFVGLSSPDTKDISELTEGPQGEATDYFKVQLPSLKEAGLVYRSDSREPAVIKSHGGSTARSHLDATKLAEVGLTQSWNPFGDPAELKKLWLRLGNVDNDLQTVVSLAVDPRDAVKFPLPGSNKSDGKKVTGGTDKAHLYVIWINDKQVIDTSAEITKRTGADRFGRGELGAASVPYDTHLLHIVTERFFDDKSVAYVAGKVSEVELIQPDSVYLQLPAVTRRALFDVIAKLTGGQLGWLIHKPGYSEATATPRMKEIEELVAKGPNTPSSTDDMTKRTRRIEELAMVQTQRQAIEAANSDVKDIGRDMFEAYDRTVEVWANGLGNRALVNALETTLRPLVSEAVEMRRLFNRAGVNDPKPLFDAKLAFDGRFATLATTV